MENLNKDALEYLVGLGANAIGAPMHHPAGGLAIMAPEGYKINHLPPIDKPLTHINQKVTFADAASFISYVNEYKYVATKIFANPDSRTFTAIIDYHNAEGSAAGYCDHGASYVCRFSNEFERWKAINGRMMKQKEFAEFIEENLTDIHAKSGFPGPLDLLEIATKLQVSKSIDVQSVQNLQNGATQFVFLDETKANAKGNQSLIVPKKIAIAVPVFFGSEKFSLEAFLRYDVTKEDGVLFAIKFERLEKAIEMAFAEVVADVANGTELPILWGYNG